MNFKRFKQSLAQVTSNQNAKRLKAEKEKRQAAERRDLYLSRLQADLLRPRNCGPSHMAGYTRSKVA